MTEPVSTPKIAGLSAAIEARLPQLLQRVPSLPDELCYEVQPDKLKEVCLALRDTPELKFEILVDVAGIDYLHYAKVEWKTYSATTSGFSRGVNPLGPRVPHDGARFAVAYHLLSITHNQRLRLRSRCVDAEDPIIDSVVDIWPGANWFEREAFDLFGILFDGHPDLRRILMPDDWEGYPMRKDYPVQIKQPVKTYEPLQVTQEEFVANLEAAREHGQS
jgi:NADH-quinone oxidoreductase subunit C